MLYFLDDLYSKIIDNLTFLGDGTQCLDYFF